MTHDVTSMVGTWRGGVLDPWPHTNGSPRPLPQPAKVASPIVIAATVAFGLTLAVTVGCLIGRATWQAVAHLTGRAA